MALILAIESSCDETSVAITRDGKLLSNVINTQIEVHQKYGGVMPEIASRLHCENIGLVLQEALEKANVKLEEVDAYESNPDNEILIGNYKVDISKYLDNLNDNFDEYINNNKTVKIDNTKDFYARSINL